MSEMKNCPFCGEEIRLKAIKCKHCGSSLNDARRETSQQVLLDGRPTNYPLPSKQGVGLNSSRLGKSSEPSKKTEEEESSIGDGSYRIHNVENARQLRIVENTRRLRIAKAIGGGFLILLFVLVYFLLPTHFSATSQVVLGFDLGDVLPTFDNPETDTVAYLGEPIRVGNIELTVLSVEQKSEVGSIFLSSSAPRGATFIAVTYLYKNVTDRPISSFWNTPDVSLIDENGSTYSADIGASVSFAGEFSNDFDANILSDMNPGVSYKDGDVFEVSSQSFNLNTWKIIFNGERGKQILLFPRPRVAAAQAATSGDSSNPALNRQSAEITSGAIETTLPNIDFGDDTSQWSNDGECDDPRFEGDGMGLTGDNDHIRHDATDCRNLHQTGSIRLAAPF